MTIKELFIKVFVFSHKMIELDGAHLEGGGALVRTALALSTLTNQPFKVINIRAGRPKPGLKAQHLTAIRALTKICGAKTSDVEIGTNEFWYYPGKIKKGTYEINIGTAGSISLLSQALILPCLFAPGKIILNIKGGTCGKWQASVDYLENILLPHLKRFVERIELKVIKRGYYPKGGGEVNIIIKPKFKLKDYPSFADFNQDLIFNLSKIHLIDQGDLEIIKGIVNVSFDLLEKEVGERIKNSAENLLKKYEVPIRIRIDYSKTFSTGGEIVLWATFSKNGQLDFENPVRLAGDALIEQKKSSEQIGKEAVEKLSTEIKSGTALDKNLVDQLVPFMALLPDSEIEPREISQHARTNMYVIEQFLPVTFEIKNNKIITKQK